MNRKGKRVRSFTIPPGLDPEDYIERVINKASEQLPNAKRITVRTKLDGSYELVTFRQDIDDTRADLIKEHAKKAKKK